MTLRLRSECVNHYATGATMNVFFNLYPPPSVLTCKVTGSFRVIIELAKQSCVNVGDLVAISVVV